VRAEYDCLEGWGWACKVKLSLDEVKGLQNDRIRCNMDGLSDR